MIFVGFDADDGVRARFELDDVGHGVVIGRPDVDAEGSRADENQFVREWTVNRRRRGKGGEIVLGPDKARAILRPRRATDPGQGLLLRGK